jgi:TolA-binding protein
MGHELNARSLERLGKAIAAVQDDALGPIVERAGERFMTPSRQASRRSARRTLRVAWIAAATVAAAVMILLLGLRSGSSRPIAFDVGSKAGTVNEWVLVSSEEVPLRFSDGATILLDAHAQSMVTELAPNGARVTLARGGAHISIPPRAGTSWRFDVGPFNVRVTGTRFDTSWDPANEVFELDLHDGSVVVSGPEIVGQRTVIAGQRVQIGLARSESAALDVSAPVGPSDAGALPPLALGTASAPGPSAVPAHGAPVHDVVGTDPHRWRPLAFEGRYAEAMVAASPIFDTICASSPSSDVIALGDAARLSGDTLRATRAYEAARQRFAGTPDAALAAFALGRLAADKGADADAAQWFEAFVRERPDDRLAREALGRLMETRSRQGATAIARDLAEQYLAKYPDGPHAKLARKLKGE